MSYAPEGVIRRIERHCQQCLFPAADPALDDKVWTFEIHSIAVIDVEPDRIESVGLGIRSGCLRDLHVGVTACKVKCAGGSDAVVV